VLPALFQQQLVSLSAPELAEPLEASPLPACSVLWQRLLPASPASCSQPGQFQGPWLLHALQQTGMKG
jgi:hypothetical protein